MGSQDVAQHMWFVGVIPLVWSLSPLTVIPAALPFRFLVLHISVTLQLSMCQAPQQKKWPIIIEHCNYGWKDCN